MISSSNTCRKVLVIGHSGQLAHALAEQQSQREHLDITCVGRPEVDLCDSASVLRILEKEQPDVVVNAAAYTAVDKAEDDKDLAYSINASGVRTLARLCNQCSTGLIHVSTDYVFDGSGSIPLDESTPVAPLGVYGQTKLEGERFALAEHPSSVVIRTSWVYGDAGSNFVTTMLRLAESRDTLGVVADQYGRPTYATDLASTILEIAAQLNGTQGGVYHYSNEGAVTSWHGFAEAIFSEAKKSGLKTPSLINAISTDQYPTPAKRPAWSALALEKIKNTFGVSIPDWTDSLATYFNKR